MVSRSLDFPIFDADNHMYETVDSFTRYLPKEFEGVVKYVEVGGRTKIAINNKISEYIPNPTFNVVAPPGAQEIEFKLKNPSSRSKADTVQLEPPPRYIRSLPGFFSPEPRIALMDEMGVDRSLMWPTLASLLEERLTDDPRATHAVVHSLNQWMHEEWTFNYQDRIFPTPIITLPIVDKAIEELEWVVERGARIILIRPAPVPGFEGLRSFALPEFDPFWKKVEEADILVGLHASDSGYQRHLNEWEGQHGEFLPFKGPSAFNAIVHTYSREIYDTVASIIGHGLAHRFPKLRFAPVENGSAWVRPMVNSLRNLYERTPSLFPEDPMVTFQRNIFVHPFHEEDTQELIDLVGEDNVIFGSDYPHPEGMADPITFVDELDSLTPEAQAKVMGGNLGRLMKVAA